MKRRSGKVGAGTSGSLSVSHWRSRRRRPTYARRPSGRADVASPSESPPCSRSSVDERCIVGRVADHRDEGVILRRRADHRGTADVDLLDGLSAGHAGPRHRRLEGIEIADDEIDLADRMGRRDRRGRIRGSRRARMPPWIFGCSVLTRPPSISGLAVSSATSSTGRPASRRAVAVPPEAIELDAESVRALSRARRARSCPRRRAARARPGAPASRVVRRILDDPGGLGIM